MKSLTPQLRPLIVALVLAGVISLPMTASADEPTTSFSVFLRVLSEMVNASGSVAESLDRKGWHITDAWGGGSPNSGNWGGLFFDMGHQINDDLRAVGRYSFSLTTDGTRDVNRDVYVGLQSKRYGRLIAGRIETPYKLAGIGWDPMNATFLQARGNQGRSGTAFGHHSMLNRTVNYSHTFGKVQFVGFVGIDDSSDPGTGKTRGNHTYSFSAIAPVGPVQLMLAHIDASEYRDGPADRKGTKFGARYSEGPLTVAGHYEIRGEGAEDGDFLFLTSSYRLGKWQYNLSYGQFKDAQDGRNNDGDYFAVSARYIFSPGVDVHGGFRRTDQDVTGTENMFGIGMRVFFNTGNLLTR